jgi:hypothetical protein
MLPEVNKQSWWYECLYAGLLYVQRVAMCVSAVQTFRNNNRLSAPYPYDRLPFHQQISLILHITAAVKFSVTATLLFNNYFQSVCACTTFTDMNCILLTLDGVTVYVIYSVCVVLEFVRKQFRC